MSSDIEKRYLRLKHIVGCEVCNPPIPHIIPISASTWWRGVKKGIFPKPYRIGSVTVWEYGEIIAAISGHLIAD